MKKPEKTLEDLIAALPEATIRRFLLEAAQNDTQLADRITLAATPADEEPSLTGWKKEIGRRVRELEKSLRKIGTGDYYDEEDYDRDVWDDDIDGLEACLSDYTRILSENGRFWEAYTLVEYAYSLIIKLDYDDGFDISYRLNEIISDQWSVIVRAASPEARCRIYEGLLSVSYENDREAPWSRVTIKAVNALEHTDETAFRVIMNDFTDKELLERTERLIREILRERADKDSDGYWVKQLITILVKLNRSTEEIHALFTQYRELDSLKPMFINFCIDRQLYEEAEELLQECIAAAIRASRDETEWNSRGYWLSAENFTKRLISLYGLMGRTDDRKETLRTYLLTYCQTDLGTVLAFKETVDPAQWPEERERLLASDTLKNVRPAFMAEEGLFRRLLDLAEADPTLSMLTRYETLLKPHFPEEIRDVILNYLRGRAATACCREHYAQLAARLKSLRDYPDGEAAAQALAEEWRVQHKRRSAFMDELKKAGF